MATLVFTDAEVTINSVDLSDHVRSVTLDYSAEMQDDTAMGDDTRSSTPGLKNWTMTVEFQQDYDAASVDATLFPLIGASAFTVTVKPVKSSATSSTNPQYSGSAVLERYGPVSANVGQLGTVSATFRAAGTLSRATV